MAAGAASAGLAAAAAAGWTGDPAAVPVPALTRTALMIMPVSRTTEALLRRLGGGTGRRTIANALLRSLRNRRTRRATVAQCHGVQASSLSE